MSPLPLQGLKLIVSVNQAQIFKFLGTNEGQCIPFLFIPVAVELVSSREACLSSFIIGAMATRISASAWRIAWPHMPSTNCQIQGMPLASHRTWGEQSWPIQTHQTDGVHNIYFVAAFMSSHGVHTPTRDVFPRWGSSQYQIEFVLKGARFFPFIQQTVRSRNPKFVMGVNIHRGDLDFCWPSIR